MVSMVFTCETMGKNHGNRHHFDLPAVHHPSFFHGIPQVFSTSGALTIQLTGNQHLRGRRCGGSKTNRQPQGISDRRSWWAMLVILVDKVSDCR